MNLFPSYNLTKLKKRLSSPSYIPSFHLCLKSDYGLNLFLEILSTVNRIVKLETEDRISKNKSTLISNETIILERFLSPICKKMVKN